MLVNLPVFWGSQRKRKIDKKLEGFSLDHGLVNYWK